MGVWIGGKYIGGCENGPDPVNSPGLIPLHLRGEPFDKLAAAGAIETGPTGAAAMDEEEEVEEAEASEKNALAQQAAEKKAAEKKAAEEKIAVEKKAKEEAKKAEKET